MHEIKLNLRKIKVSGNLDMEKNPHGEGVKIMDEEGNILNGIVGLDMSIDPGRTMAILKEYVSIEFVEESTGKPE